MNKLTFAICILVVMCAVSAAEQSIKDFCTPHTQDFVEKATKKTIQWRAVDTFLANKNILGAGAFGTVKSAMYPGTAGKVMVAIKQIAITEDNYMTLPLIVKELKVNELVATKDPTIGPMFYGCQFTLDQEGYLTGIYMVNQMLFRTLEKDGAAMRAMGKLRYFYLNFQIIDKLDRLWKLGYRHSDIKPGNIMVDEGRNNAYLVDFGLAQETTGECVPSGTPGYLAPGAWTVRDECIQRDDIYSWFVTFIAALSPKGEQSIWDMSKDEARCIDSQPDDECMTRIRVGAVAFLQENGWGEWDIIGSRIQKQNISDLASTIFYIDKSVKEYYYEDIKEIIVNQQYKIKDILGGKVDKNNYDLPVRLNERKGELFGHYRNLLDESSGLQRQLSRVQIRV